MQQRDVLRRQWDDMSEYWIRGAGQEVHRVGLLDDNMKDVVGDVSGKDLIDLGCGEGRFSRMMTMAGANVTGLDFFRHSSNLLRPTG